MTLTAETAADVLAQLHGQLGDFDPDTRALVGLRQDDDGTVDLEDLDIDDTGILAPGDGIDAVVLVTAQAIELASNDEQTTLRQLVAVMRDGLEVGVFRVGEEDDSAYVWTTADPEDDNVTSLRPREMAANQARRAFGLDSYTDEVPVTELLSRLWLLHIAQQTLERFDANGTEVVTVDQLREADTAGPFAPILDDPSYPDDEVAAARQLVTDITWEDVRQLAVRGQFDVGPYTFDPDHADWLDAPGFAQHFDETVMGSDQILASLDVMGERAVVDWAVAQLDARGWLAPSVTTAAADRPDA